MSRTNDVVFIFTGGVPFSSTFPVQAEFNHQLWRDNESKLQYRRQLLKDSRGVDNDIKSNLGTVMNTITSFARMDTIGQVCLLGRSAGCLLALAVAAELNAQGVAELTFIGLSDVPMYHDGNQPPVPRVGAIKPKNGPIASGAVAPEHSRFTRNIKPVSEVPHAKLDQEIKVKQGNKIQLYQIGGNHMKYVSSRKEWTWYSDKTMGGEVHGELDDGWDNQKKVVKGGRLFDDDLDFHIHLNTGDHWKEMCKKAAQEFANLPPAPAP